MEELHLHVDSLSQALLVLDQRTFVPQCPSKRIKKNSRTLLWSALFFQNFQSWNKSKHVKTIQNIKTCINVLFMSVYSSLSQQASLQKKTSNFQAHVSKVCQICQHCQKGARFIKVRDISCLLRFISKARWEDQMRLPLLHPGNFVQTCRRAADPRRKMLRGRSLKLRMMLNSYLKKRSLFWTTYECLFSPSLCNWLAGAFGI